MPQFNLSTFDFIKLIQSLQPLFFYKWIFIFFILAYVIFHLIILNQIRSMDKIITQPLSSAILGFISLSLLAAGVLLIVFVFSIRI
jgi:hypothetical protein